MAEDEPKTGDDPKSSLERQLDLLQHHCLFGHIHYRMWHRLNASFGEKPELGNLAPSFFLFAAEAHLNSVFLIVSRLVDRRRDTLSIERFLEAADRAAGTFPGVRAEEVRMALAEDRTTLGGLEETIEKIRVHRNEQFVHLSRELLRPPFGVTPADEALMYEDVLTVRLMSSPDRQLWAWVPPQEAWRQPGLPREWVPVLHRNEDAMTPEPLPGYVRLDSKPRRVHVWAEHLEFRDDRPAGLGD
jgi:hypothetical protein